MGPRLAARDPGGASWADPRRRLSQLPGKLPTHKFTGLPPATLEDPSSKSPDSAEQFGCTRTLAAHPSLESRTCLSDWKPNSGCTIAGVGFVNMIYDGDPIPPNTCVPFWLVCEWLCCQTGRSIECKKMSRALNSKPCNMRGSSVRMGFGGGVY